MAREPLKLVLGADDFLSAEMLAAAPKTFEALTGLTPAAFEALVEDVEPRLRAAVEQARRNRPGRLRGPGAGRPFKLSLRDRLLLLLSFRRHRMDLYHLGYYFGVDGTTGKRIRKALTPLLEGNRLAGSERRSTEQERHAVVRTCRSEFPDLHLYLAMLLGISEPYFSEAGM